MHFYSLPQLTTCQWRLDVLFAKLLGKFKTNTKHFNIPLKTGGALQGANDQQRGWAWCWLCLLVLFTAAPLNIDRSRFERWIRWITDGAEARRGSVDRGDPYTLLSADVYVSPFNKQWAILQRRCKIWVILTGGCFLSCHHINIKLKFPQKRPAPDWLLYGVCARIRR